MNEIEKLRKYRIDNNLTYEDLAREMDIPSRTVYRWLKENKGISRVYKKIIQEFLSRKGFFEKLLSA